MDGEVRRFALAVVHLPLMTGPLPVIVLIAAGCAIVWLLVRARRVSRFALAMSGVVAAVVTSSAAVLVEWLWTPFWDGLPIKVYVWLAAALFLGGVSLAALAREAWGARATTVAAFLLVLCAAVMQTNISLDDYPTVAAALGHPPVVTGDPAELESSEAELIDAVPTDREWRPPAAMPRRGEVTQVTIPGTASGFVARPASIYLPPAYLTDPRAELPVLVLMTGQPGQVTDWITGGNLVGIMDGFADAHDGLAPAVVMVDALGSFDANPMCMNSNLGNVATYLAIDVPNWVENNVQVSTDPARWAIGGFSYGGTCGLQMAVNAPDVYPTFIDLSGEDEPRTGTRQESVVAAFGDDSEASEARFESVAPLDVMSRNDFPGTAGAFAVGTDDLEFGPQTRRAYSAALAAGMDVHYSELPGAHSMDVWSPGLAGEMDWLAKRLGLTP